MKYDDASWHYGGDFPPDLPPEFGATHIAMFMAWAFTRGYTGAIHLEDADSARDVERIKSRSMDPREFLIRRCDEKLTHHDLNEEANRFTQAYYSASYFADLEETFGSDSYDIANSWENYDRIAAVLDRRFQEWRASHA